VNRGAQRVICLADLDCFFVEVERRHRPELAGRAVVIGGRPGERGVVAACSYEARALGIHSAMPMGEAYRLAGMQTPAFASGSQPEFRTLPATGVVFLHDGLFGNYERYSRRVQDILRGAVPSFRARSIDEFELDISGCERLFERDFGGITQFAEHLRRRVKAEVGLKLSIGIGPSRLVAKMASRHAKPDGVFRVLPNDVAAFLTPHDVQAVPGIGPATAAKLRALGINTVGQLLAQPDALLRHVFGIGMQGLVQALRNTGQPEPQAVAAFGIADSAPSASPRRPKSIGHETTFARDTVDPAVWERTLWRLTEDACRRLRAADLRAGQVTVKIRYSDFATLTHGEPLGEPSDVDDVIFARARELFQQANTRRLRIRLLGVRLERLSVGASQERLFETQRMRRAHDLFAAVDRIRAKHGDDAVLVGPGVARLTEQQPLSARSTAGIQTGFMHGRG
jgi:DNA polymerase IV